MMAGEVIRREEMRMDWIQTVYGVVKITSMNLEKLCINGFVIPLHETEEYIDEVPIPDGKIIKTIIEEKLKGKDFIEGEQEEFNIDCVEEDYGQKIVAFWKISFEIIKYYRLKPRELKLVKLCYAHNKKNIPFKIENAMIWIKVGKKKVRVLIPAYLSTVSENISVNLEVWGCRLEGIYK
ncbi:MAG: hypothetical protein WC306_02165 [Candidatus Paceibacterota bacterium]|jgi:hypothetical protein